MKDAGKLRKSIEPNLIIEYRYTEIPRHVYLKLGSDWKDPSYIVFYQMLVGVCTAVGSGMMLMGIWPGAVIFALIASFTICLFK